MREGRLGYNSSNGRYGFFVIRFYGLIQDFIVGNAWKY